ncbi:MAG: hypothetical protein JWO67_3010 [Streptosporangiaceae bacterium]|nr:hypothetical protein [Streptosporangiaceae bacterium]
MPGDQDGRGRRGWRAAAWTLKVALVVLLLFALTHQDWPRFADKAMVARAVAYPLAALLVPLVWWVRRRMGRPVPYAWDVDALLVSPFVIDVAGNALDLYDTVTWFDDLCHFGNWALLVGAVGVALRRGAGLPRWALALMCSGIGAITAIVWEIAEYGAFILNTPESVGIYRDTLGDEAMGLMGSTVAGLLLAVRTGRGRGPRPEAALGTPAGARPG